MTTAARGRAAAVGDVDRDRGTDVQSERPGRGGKSLPRPAPWGKGPGRAFVRCRSAAWGWLGFGGKPHRWQSRHRSAIRWGKLAADGITKSTDRANRAGAGRPKSPRAAQLLI